MLDRDLVLDAIEDAQRILTEHTGRALIGIPKSPSTCFYSCWIGARWWPLADGSALAMGCAS
jgi:hypothetical protein